MSSFSGRFTYLARLTSSARLAACAHLPSSVCLITSACLSVFRRSLRKRILLGGLALGIDRSLFFLTCRGIFIERRKIHKVKIPLLIDKAISVCGKILVEKRWASFWVSLKNTIPKILCIFYGISYKNFKTSTSKL